MSTELDTIKEKIAEKRNFLQQTYGVQKIGIFGSFISGKQTKESDVDIMVEFSRPIGLDFFELATYLESQLGRKVDLVTSKGIRPAFRKYIFPEVVYL